MAVESNVARDRKPAPPISYHAQYLAACLVLLLIVFFGAVQVADPVKLGVSDQFREWAKVLTAVLGVAQSLLPRVTARPNDTRTGID